MKEIKKKIIYFLGAILTFAFKRTGASAQMQVMYGVAPPNGIEMYGVSGPYIEPTLWEKILTVVLSPIFMAGVAVTAIIIGVVLVVKRKKKKNAQKDF